MRRPGFGLRPALPGAIVALLLSACGGSASRRPAAAPASHRVQPVSLMLDFTPNAIHVGIYDALARHLDARNGIRLHVEVPGQSTDAISELEAGRVDFAILDIHDLALAREKHAPIVGILPIVSGRVAAATAFWNDEGMTITRRRPGYHVFRVTQYGAPSYPELVVCAPTPPARAHRGLRRWGTLGGALRNRQPSAGRARRVRPGVHPALSGGGGAAAARTLSRSGRRTTARGAS